MIMKSICLASLSSVTASRKVNRFDAVVSADSRPSNQNMLSVALSSQQRRIQLQARQLNRCHLGHKESVTLKVDAGQLWVTMENDPIDHVLISGMVVTFTGPGLLLLEALDSEAVLSLVLTTSQQ